MNSIPNVKAFASVESTFLTHMIWFIVLMSQDNIIFLLV